MTNLKYKLQKKHKLIKKVYAFYYKKCRKLANLFELCQYVCYNTDRLQTNRYK